MSGRVLTPIKPEDVPEEFVSELVRMGQIPASIARGIPMERRPGERCICGHVRECHDGPCTAKGCRKFGGCTGFVQDESLRIRVTAGSGKGARSSRAVKIPMKVVAMGKGGWTLTRARRP